MSCPEVWARMYGFFTSVYTIITYDTISSIPNTCTFTLTRYNKIAIQGAPQMTVDKEAIHLSRVYSYYSKCYLHLFYVKPALTRYLSILFLNILTLLACTHSADNLFHTLMVL